MADTTSNTPFSTNPAPGAADDNRPRCAAVLRILIHEGQADTVIALPCGQPDPDLAEQFVTGALQKAESVDITGLSDTERDFLEAVADAVRVATATSIQLQLLNVLDPVTTAAVIEEKRLQQRRHTC